VKVQTAMTILLYMLSFSAAPQFARFPLFNTGKPTKEIITKKQTSGLTASETIASRRVYQVFRSKSGQDLFRAEIGLVINSEPVKFWNYGSSTRATSMATE
jgi:hypothetical protein